MNNVRSGISPVCELHAQYGKKHPGYILALASSARSDDGISVESACALPKAVSRDLLAYVATQTEAEAVRAAQDHNMLRVGSPNLLSLYAGFLLNPIHASLLIPFHPPTVAGGAHAYDSAVTSLYQRAILIPGLYQLL